MEHRDDANLPVLGGEGAVGNFGPSIEKTPEMFLQQLPNNPKDPNGLWKLPQKPLKMKAKMLREQAIPPVGYHYHHYCILLSKHWNVPVADCLPAETRRLTPYSFALLSRLRNLASHSKNMMAQAHGAILLVRAKRLRMLGLAIDQELEFQFVKTVVPHEVRMEYGEGKITENVFGVTLGDVCKANEIILSLRKETLEALAAKLKPNKEKPTSVTLAEADLAKLAAEWKATRSRKKREAEKLDETYAGISKLRMADGAKGMARLRRHQGKSRRFAAGPVLLPSERLDFGSLGTLQKPDEAQQMAKEMEKLGMGSQSGPPTGHATGGGDEG